MRRRGGEPRGLGNQRVEFGIGRQLLDRQRGLPRDRGERRRARRPPTSQDRHAEDETKPVSDRAERAHELGVDRERDIVVKLKQLYPKAKCALDFTNAFELLIATMLSAQSTDARVNIVTPALFRKYPDARMLAKAKPAALELEISDNGRGVSEEIT